MTWFKAIAEVVAVLWALIQIVERPGEGAQKKTEVITKAKEWLAAAKDRMPKWLYELVASDTFLGFVVDAIVWAANRYGFFQSER